MLAEINNIIYSKRNNCITKHPFYRAKNIQNQSCVPFVDHKPGLYAVLYTTFYKLKPAVYRLYYRYQHFYLITFLVNH